MQIVDVQDTDLTYLISRVDKGETVVLERDGIPIARLTPEVSRASIPKSGGGFGFMKGKMRVPSDIKTPFAVNIEDMFYGNPDIEPNTVKS